MHKLFVIATAFAIGTAGAAGAQNFKLSEPNSPPPELLQNTTTGSVWVDRETTTSSVGAPTISGLSAPAWLYGFSAAQGFAPSDENNNPVPRFQVER